MNEALADELAEAAQGLNALARERLHGLGVSLRALFDAIGACDPFWPVGVLRIEVDRSGLWQPSEHGRPAIVQPVVTGGCLLDLVAWRSADPLRWHLRTGHAWALGVDRIDEVLSAWEPETLRVHASPLQWLAAGGDGLVVLDWQAPELAELRVLSSIRVPTRDFGRVLTDALMRAPRLPTITPETERVACAA